MLLSYVEKNGIDFRKTGYQRKDFCRIQQQLYIYEGLISRNYLTQRLPYLLHYHMIRALAGKPSDQLNAAIDDLTHDLRLLYYPWLDLPESDKLKGVHNYINERMELWQQIFGRLDDPDTQQRLQEAIDRLN